MLARFGISSKVLRGQQHRHAHRSAIRKVGVLCSSRAVLRRGQLTLLLGRHDAHRSSVMWR